MSKSDVTAVKGRAITARPSLCLLMVLAAFGAASIFASAAPAATNGQLALTGTTPPSSASSPAESTTPLIRGGESGIIISVIGPRALRPVQTSVWGAPANTVNIYTDPKCEGTPIATGTFAELKSPGIQVIVEEDSTTTFYASQTEVEDPFETSDCSTPGLTYYQGEAVDPPDEEEPPTGGGENPPAGGGSGGGSGNGPGVSPVAPVAPRIHVEPSNRANLNTPRIAGSAAGAERVRIFVSARCGGAPITETSGAELAAGVAVRVADDSETAFSALSLSGGVKSECSPSTTFIEDSTAPRTRITMAPGSKTRRRKAVFRFADVSGDPTGTNFECKLDRRKWRACYSPFKVKGLGYNRHTLRIRGADAAGNFEAKAVKRSFKVVKR
jgi:hypothetical protein